MFAVIRTGGKQYKVEEGQTLSVERLADEKGKIVFSDVLLL
ncbi:MAG: bL21 family ribosomal protein, partial [bacterium]